MPTIIDQNAPWPVPQRKYRPPNTAGKKPAAKTAPEKLVSSTTPAGGYRVTANTTKVYATMDTFVHVTVDREDEGFHTFQMSPTAAVPTISITEASEDMPAANKPVMQMAVTRPLSNLASMNPTTWSVLRINSAASRSVAMPCTSAPSPITHTSDTPRNTGVQIIAKRMPAALSTE